MLSRAERGCGVGLGGWIYHQRVGKKKLDRGEPCKGMTAARAAKLDALGFAWEAGQSMRTDAGAVLARHRRDAHGARPGAT